MAFLTDLGLAAPGWQGRVKEAAYTSPKGVRIPFLFDEFSRTTEKRTAEFNFNALDGSYIQDNGFGARKYAIRCIFTGTNHDLVATSFEAALLERGTGVLEHPLYGTFDVVPMGSIARRNDLVRAANQSIVEVTFSTTLANVYPSGTGDPKNEISASLSDFDLAAALDFQDGVDLSNPVSQAVAKTQIENMLTVVSDTLSGVADATAESQRAFDQQLRAINNGLDILVGQPLNLAQQITNLIKSPAQALTGIESRLVGYGNFALRLIDDIGKVGTNSDLGIVDHFLTSGVAGTVLATNETEYTRRSQALETADNMGRIASASYTAREDAFKNGGATDPGRGYQQIQGAQAFAEGYLVDLSFDLLNERVIYIATDRSTIAMCAEFYGSVSDERIQFFIDTNGLGGEEIYTAKRGRKIVYYV